MVGLSILKHLENLSDDVLVERWSEPPYYQAFTGATEFQWALPCDPSDLTYFRKRIGSDGHEKNPGDVYHVARRAKQKKMKCVLIPRYTEKKHHLSNRCQTVS